MTVATKNGKGATGDIGKSEVQTIILPRRNLVTFRMRIVGETPLISHRFGEDAIRQIEKIQSGEAKMKKAPRNPQREFEQAQYRLPDGGYGFPASAIKLAMTIAGQREADEKRTELMGRISIPAELLRIETQNPPRMRTDRVRLSGMAGVTSLAYRPEYWPWAATVPIRFNAATITLDKVVNILDLAGSCVGIGDWRVDRKGIFGQWTVDFDSIEQIA